MLRHSLLAQILTVYLLFVAMVLAAGCVVNVKIRQQLQAEIQSADLALAQAIALEVETKLHDARESLVELVRLEALQYADYDKITHTFRAFKAARPEIDHIYLLDASGILQVSVPSDARTLGTDFSDERFFKHALRVNGPVVESGIIDLTTFNAVMVIAYPVRDAENYLSGVIATNLLLDELSRPLRTIMAEQVHQTPPQHLRISIIDHRGQLIATAERERLLQRVVDELPGAQEALNGHSATQLGMEGGEEEWLFSSAPVRSVGWAVVVQRPTTEALLVVHNFNAWLTIGALFFGVGGLAFWLVLVQRVIHPLHLLALHHTALSDSSEIKERISQTPELTQRDDEVGSLARRLHQAAIIQEINQFKSTLLAAVGHELRTPLAVIKGVASTLLETDVEWSWTDKQHFLQMISDESDRLAKLVSNLLDLSRLEAGLLLLHQHPHNLHELIERVIARFGDSTIIEVPEHFPAILVDAPRFEVVLNNLLSNAFAYGATSVKIRATLQKENVKICVSDDGPGVEASELPYLFERFYRTEQGMQVRAGGTGLGLAICKAFVEAHGGKIWAETNRNSTNQNGNSPQYRSSPSSAGLSVAFTVPIAYQDKEV